MSKKVEVKFIQGFGANVLIKDFTFKQLVTALENDPHAGTIVDAEGHPVFKVSTKEEGTGSLSAAGAILTPAMKIQLGDSEATLEEVKAKYLIPIYNLQLVLENIVADVAAIEEDMKDVFTEVSIDE